MLERNLFCAKNRRNFGWFLKQTSSNVVVDIAKKNPLKTDFPFPTCSLHDGGKAAAGERTGPVQARPARPGGRPRLHRGLAARPCSHRDGPQHAIAQMSSILADQ